jgi:hypothetical protein
MSIRLRMKLQVDTGLNEWPGSAHCLGARKAFWQIYLPAYLFMRTTTLALGPRHTVRPAA